MLLDPTLPKQIKAYQLFKKGLCPEQIVDRLQTDIQTTERWIDIIQAQGGISSRDEHPTAPWLGGELLETLWIGGQLLTWRILYKIKSGEVGATGITSN